MEILAVIGLAALIAIVGCVMGQVWGPLMVGLGFAGWGALLLLSGFRSPGPELGLLYLGGSFTEFVAASEFWDAQHSPLGPSAKWTLTAALVGFVGTVGVVVLVFMIAAAVVGSLII